MDRRVHARGGAGGGRRRPRGRRGAVRGRHRQARPRGDARPRDDRPGVAAAAPGRGAGSPRARLRDGDDGAPAARPPLVPWFVVGFLVAVLVRATSWLPEPVLDVAAVVQQLLLATAMAALGLGVRLRSIAAVGPRPLVLGAASTAVAMAVGGAGALLLP
ncbi:putative sulfate exporter family transporter [Micrococcus sp. HG099]|uniref:putative sulfate exporter family transporter n=1 Tax=Micrococcus sp. HG099 TaxID=2969755 RepID=UPI00215A97F7|nr:putative sulfate exporter family transporter [Micrococcus sp. HG099]MCR8675389.1 putative sulfate exporter family transporter [Micrococcus sp. HG099]